MAPPFDSRRLFNDATYSDITIKFGGREIKCHKIILCSASDYFKACCGPQSRFVESNKSSIELHGDDPTAVEVILRFIYNFEYHKMEEHVDMTPQTHVNIITAAKKYLLPKLEHKAISNLESAIVRTEVALTMQNDPEPMIDVIFLLTEQSGFCTVFEGAAPDLVRNYLAELFKIPRFRQWLETPNGEASLALAMESMTWGSKVLAAADWKTVKIARDPRCHNSSCESIQSYGPAGCQLLCANCGTIHSHKDDIIMVSIGKADEIEREYLREDLSME